VITANAVLIQTVTPTQSATAASVLMRQAENALLIQTAASKVQNAIQANAPTHLTANVPSVLNARAENAIQESVSKSGNGGKIS